MIQDRDQLGLILGPDESLEDLETRALALETSPCKEEAFLEALDLVQRLYGIRPSWVRYTVSNRGLAPWHGASTTVFEDEASVRHVEVRLRRSRFWGRASRVELLAHELVHAARMGFPSGPYEEIFAYRTSRGFRRFLGPLFAASWEVYCFLFLTGLSVTLDLLLLFPLSLYFKMIPLGFLLFLLARLLLRRRTLGRCVKNFSQLTNDPWALAFRLSDEEICSFSRMAVVQIHDLIESLTSVRWQRLRDRFCR